jgi:hypothetical protein
MHRMWLHGAGHVAVWRASDAGGRACMRAGCARHEAACDAPLVGARAHTMRVGHGEAPTWGWWAVEGGM